MLYNIFSKKSNKKAKKKILKTPLIIADIHEKNSLVLSELHSTTSARLEIKSLKIADYIIGDTAIERKTTSDFISSMINKRLIQQLNQMKKYKKQILIIEGDFSSLLSEKENLQSAIRGFIISIIQNYQIPIIFTKDYEDTSKYLITLAKQQLKPKTQYTLHSRIPKTEKEQKKYILESFPNIGPVKAEKLLKEFKNLNSIFNASEEDLKKVLKNQSQKFKELLEF